MNNPALASSFASPWTQGFAALAAFVGSFALVPLSYSQQDDQVQEPHANRSPPVHADGSSSQASGLQPSPYNQQPARQPGKPVAAKASKPGDNTPPQPHGQFRPCPYPGASVAQSKTQSTGHDSQHAAKPATQRPASTGNLAEEVEKLKAYIRRQERRIDALEGKVTVADHVTGPSSNKHLKRHGDSGDSAKGIATRHDPGAGQTPSISVKSGSKGAAMAVTRAKGLYIVQRGDSLSKIARQHGVSRSTLQGANSIRNPDLLIVGQKLTIPGRSGNGSLDKKLAPKTVPGTSDAGHFVSKSATPKPAIVPPEAPPPAEAGIIGGAITPPNGSRGVTSYRVEPGDTIEGVARIYGTTAAEIQRKNKLSSPHLPPAGEEIVVPLPGSVSS